MDIGQEVIVAGLMMVAALAASAAEPESVGLAKGPSLPFTISVIAEDFKDVPEYMGGGTQHHMDFPFCAVAIDGEYWIIYRNQLHRMTHRFKGINIENAQRQPDGDAGAKGYILGGLWYDESEKKLYGPIHHEKLRLWKQISLATSTDKGLTWKNEGLIIATYDPNSQPKPIEELSGLQGKEYEGDFYLYVDKKGGYFYLYGLNYTDYKEGGHFMRHFVARCAIKDKMAPGKWTKFYNGGWTEPGLGGKSSHVNAYYVMYNTYLKRYLSFNLGSSLATCIDLEKQDWSPSFRIGSTWCPSRKFFGYHVSDETKTDIHTGDKTLFLWSYYQNNRGRRFRIEFGPGQTSNQEGFHPFGGYLEDCYQKSMGFGMLYPYFSLLESADPVMARRTRKVHCSHKEMTYSGGWKSASNSQFYLGSAQVADAAGSTVQFAFKGSDVYWRVMRGPDCGLADVYVDDRLEDRVDCYADVNIRHQFGLVKQGLDPKKAHVIKIVVRGEKNPLATATAIRHMGFEHSAEGYNASEGFSSIQGKNQWHYQERAQETCTDMTFSKSWRGAKGSEISFYKMMPSPSAQAVRKWMAPRDGRIRIEGAPALEGVNADGIVVTILKKTDQLWTAHLKTPDATVSSYDVTVDVRAGDALDFVAQLCPPAKAATAGSKPSSQTVVWDPAVTYLKVR